MITQRIVMAGVQAAVQKHDDGTRTLVLVQKDQSTDMEVHVPLSEQAAKQVGTSLSAPGIVVP